ncbi:MAG: hypothetical protein ACE5FK_00185 [Candidatus Methylomirabilia bacterium]
MGASSLWSRKIPHERTWNVAFRTVHLIAFGLVLGGHAWEVEPGRLLGAFWVTVLSGVALMGLELFKSLEWVFLGKGIMVLAKLGLLLLVPVFWDARLPLLLAVVVVASVGSHMPARFRHYSLLRRRVLLPSEEPAMGVQDLRREPAPLSHTKGGARGGSQG